MCGELRAGPFDAFIYRLLHDCVLLCCPVVCLQADNELSAEGTAVLAPELWKLTQLQTLNWTGKLVPCVAAFALVRCLLTSG